VPLVLGRSITPQEVRTGAKVAIISERIAKELGLSAPLGSWIIQDGREWEIVGVAKEALYSRLTQSRMVTYMPLPKAARAVTVILRTSVKPEGVVSAAREAVRSVDAGVPLIDIFTMEQQISRTLQRERMFAWLCGSFGVLALVLCVVGVYGLMSHSTARRTPEIGIRMALGATAKQVLREVLSEGMRLSIAGMFIGVPLAIYAAQTAQRLRLLPEGPIPYWTLGAAIAVLVISTFTAAFAPAVRASSVDPMRALRQG
jgi:ABC-type antimicrobial peptide transport system permease subunit